MDVHPFEDATPTLSIDRGQMIIALASMVDLVGMDDTNHGKRVGFMASTVLRHLGGSAAECRSVFELGLLHDCGVSTHATHANLVKHFDWSDAGIHCEIGYQLLCDFAPLAMYALPIRYHHTAWHRLKDRPLSAEDKRLANLIYLVDRVDTLAAPHYAHDILLARPEICATIASHSGHYFDPELVQAFTAVAAQEAFWIALSERHIARYTWELGRNAAPHPLTTDQLRQLARIMAYIVDQKSAFTAQHSARVAALSRFLAERCGLEPDRCDKLEIAGLLHDIGKLHTPDTILDKPGPLTDYERAVMNQHSFETYDILSRIGGIDDIAHWAAYHHDKPNGRGYPFHPGESELTQEARIIAVADVFQALVQDRPYRDGMPLTQALQIVNEACRRGELDPDIVGVLCTYAEKCFDLAHGLCPENHANELNHAIA